MAGAASCLSCHRGHQCSEALQSWPFCKTNARFILYALISRAGTCGMAEMFVWKSGRPNSNSSSSEACVTGSTMEPACVKRMQNLKQPLNTSCLLGCVVARRKSVQGQEKLDSGIPATVSRGRGSYIVTRDQGIHDAEGARQAKAKRMQLPLRWTPPRSISILSYEAKSTIDTQFRSQFELRQARFQAMENGQGNAKAQTLLPSMANAFYLYTTPPRQKQKACTQND
eukprot:1157767-Pelagomonas_calceolata.AAC.5